MRVDIEYGFYRIGLDIEDITRLGVVFPTTPGEEPLIDFPLVFPMGWKNSPPIYYTASETIAELANKSLQKPPNTSDHNIDQLASTISSPTPDHTDYKFLLLASKIHSHQDTRSSLNMIDSYCTLMFLWNISWASVKATKPISGNSDEL